LQKCNNQHGNIFFLIFRGNFLNLILARLGQVAARRASLNNADEAFGVSRNKLGNMTQERVLIVEDEENERTGLAELVSGWGYRTDTASDGVEALEKIPVFAPSIVITDVKMPRMGGMELAEKLNDLSQSIAVVMVTAQKATDTAFHAGRLGVQDYIEKPIDFRRLRSILTNIGEILNTRTENETLRRSLRDKGALGRLTGASRQM